MERTDSLEKTLMLERLKAGGERDDRGWDGWMVSLTGWTWIWASSRNWCWTGKPRELQYIGSHTTSNCTELISILQWENQQLERLSQFTKLTQRGRSRIEWGFSSRLLPQIPSPFHYTEFSEIYILIRLVVLFPLLFKNFLYQSKHKKISLVCNKWSSNPTYFLMLISFHLK